MALRVGCFTFLVESQLTASTTDLCEQQYEPVHQVPITERRTTGRNYERCWTVHTSVPFVWEAQAARGVHVLVELPRGRRYVDHNGESYFGAWSRRNIRCAIAPIANLGVGSKLLCEMGRELC
jgi:hypothetical protein